jgi:hypothetical protein
MPALAAACRIEDEEEESVRPACVAVDAGAQEAYWRRSYWRERFWRPECGYEDYAPAFCVGYVGHAQYGGTFEDAEKSLCANWERIKGDSPLALDEALLAIRAAWRRMEQATRPAQPAPQARWREAANQASHAC